MLFYVLSQEICLLKRSKSCHQLRNGCKTKIFEIKPDLLPTRTYIHTVCRSLDAKFTFKNMLNYSKEFKKCVPFSIWNEHTMFLNSNKASILDNSLDIVGILNFTSKTYRLRMLNIRNLKGFDLNLSETKTKLDSEFYMASRYLKISIYDSKFDFYLNGKLKKTCSS